MYTFKVTSVSNKRVGPSSTSSRKKNTRLKLQRQTFWRCTSNAWLRGRVHLAQTRPPTKPQEKTKVIIPELGGLWIKFSTTVPNMYVSPDYLLCWKLMLVWSPWIADLPQRSFGKGSEEMRRELAARPTWQWPSGFVLTWRFMNPSLFHINVSCDSFRPIMLCLV